MEVKAYRYDRCDKLYGEPQYTEKEGVVTFIDSIGQIHTTAGDCAIIPGGKFSLLLFKKRRKMSNDCAAKI